MVLTSVEFEYQKIVRSQTDIVVREYNQGFISLVIFDLDVQVGRANSIFKHHSLVIVVTHPRLGLLISIDLVVLDSEFFVCTVFSGLVE